MMKFMFVYPNVSKAYTPQMGLLSLVSFLLEHGVDAFVCDLTFDYSSKYADHVLQDIDREKPDVIGISCRSMEYLTTIDILSEIRKKYKNILTLVGGPHATFVPEKMVIHADYIVRGEGEVVCLDIAHAVAAGRRNDISQLDNIAFFRNGEMSTNQLRPLFDLDKAPLPRYEIFDERHYTSHSFLGIVPGAKVCGVFEGSRGCPFRCTYCSNAALQDLYRGTGRWRREKSALMLRKEINHFRSLYEMDAMYWIDEVVMTSDNRTSALNESLRDLKIPLIFMERPEMVFEKRVKDMKDAGAYSCSIGIESANQQFRQRMLGRGVPDEKIVEACALIKRNGVKTHAFMMMGLPEQSKEVMRESCYLLKKIQPDSAQATTYFPLPGTQLLLKSSEMGLFDGMNSISSYYSTSQLNYSGYHKMSISKYSAIINLALWKNGLVRELLFQFCLKVPYMAVALYHAKVIYDSVRRVGLRGTVSKAMYKLSKLSIE